MRHITSSFRYHPEPSGSSPQHSTSGTATGDLLERLVARDNSAAERVWPDGTLRFYIVADGFNSNSDSGPAVPGKYTNWLYDLRPKLREVEPGTPVVGFSYLEPGYRYTRGTTHVRIGELSKKLIGSYLPPSYGSITYCAFSLAGLLFAYELGQWARRQQSPQQPMHTSNSASGPMAEPLESDANTGVTQPSNIPGSEITRDAKSERKPNTLLLVQPAFFISLEAANTLGQQRVPIVLELTRAAKSLQAGRPNKLVSDLLSGLQALTSYMNVRMLYWPGDKFLSYPDAFLRELRSIGIEPIELPIDSELPIPKNREGDDFYRHSRVSRVPTTYRRIQEVVQSLHGDSAAS